jgi:hypothetical protein
LNISKAKITIVESNPQSNAIHASCLADSKIEASNLRGLDSKSIPIALD